MAGHRLADAETGRATASPRGWAIDVESKHQSIR
jgi:hypothetical protein